ncbi:MAG: acyl-CoA dehydrogenase family protein [Gammaproteobacteria bacterium]|nr:acyl-CoA dehydrogenase family protein [Gammaproteobacteria bacterium]
MQVEIPRELTDYLTQLDDFIAREITPLEQDNDNIRFFDHRREHSRTNWDNQGLPEDDWLELLAEATRRADAAGHFRYVLPAAYGGRDGSNLEMAVIREHLNARGIGLHNDASAEHSVVANSLLTGQLMLEFGSDAQKRDLLEGLLNGSRVLAMGITEAAHGSDATHMETIAVREGNEWVINGEKSWNSCVYVAHHDMIFARTSGKAGDAKGISAFLVPLKPELAEGFVIEEYLWTFNMPTDHARVSLKNVRVPHAAMVGSEGEGLQIAMRFFNENRIRQAAASLGAAQYCIDASIQYAKLRAPFGKPLATNQAIQFPLVELQTEAEMIRALLYKTATLMDKYGAGSQADKVSMLNYRANRLCCEAADRAIQVHGGMGYSRHKQFEHIYRHHRRYRITEGTDEIQMRRVAGHMFGFMGGDKK